MGFLGEVGRYACDGCEVGIICMEKYQEWYYKSQKLKKFEKCIGITGMLFKHWLLTRIP